MLKAERGTSHLCPRESCSSLGLEHFEVRASNPNLAHLPQRNLSRVPQVAVVVVAHIFCVRRVCSDLDHDPPVGVDGAVHGRTRLVQGAVGDCQVLSPMAVALVPPFRCAMGWGMPIGQPCNAGVPHHHKLLLMSHSMAACASQRTAPLARGSRVRAIAQLTVHVLLATVEQLLCA